jgi:hypothetical protein
MQNQNISKKHRLLSTKRSGSTLELSLPNNQIINL